jgi:integrase
MSRAVVTVYARHRATCSHASRGEFYRGCNCTKWLRYSLNGKQYRKTADTRTWGIAEEKAADLQKQLDTGSAGIVPASPSQRQSIAAAIETYVTGKESEGVSPRRIKKLRHQLGQFERFMAGRSKLFPALITPTDVIEFRVEWDSWPSALTRQKAQQNLRGFLRYCCRENLAELLAALKTIRLSKTDRKRLEPKPFTEKEIKTLLAQIPRTFHGERAGKASLLIRFMLSTGVAIRDAVQLERGNLQGGWLRIDRQKTSKPVRQHLDASLCQELLAGDSQYIFWDGQFLVTSAVTAWQDDLRKLMQDAGVWIKGNVSHRFRDTAVDFWLGHGCNLTEIAAMLGDTVAVCERHYANLASARMEERLAKMPKRSWEAHA